MTTVIITESEVFFMILSLKYVFLEIFFRNENASKSLTRPE